MRNVIKLSIFLAIFTIGFMSCQKDDVTYQVTFNSKGGSVVEQQTVKAGKKATKPSPTPTLANHAFGGWYKEEALTNEWNFDADVVNADITLYAKWNVNTLVVSFDSDGGSAVQSQTVNYGGKVTAPPNPTKPFTPVAGLYAGEIPEGYTFKEWQKPNGSSWNFDTETVTEDIVLKAVWQPVTINISTYFGANIVEKAVSYAKSNPAAYTLAIDDDYDVVMQRLNVANVSLTMIGLGGQRIIQYNNGDRYYNQNLFTISDGASLTLGNNITLRGVTFSYADLVEVSDGNLTMEVGSKITGHTTMSTYGSSAVGIISANALFIMNGGEISGNTGSLEGAVYIMNGGTFIMNGGIITGNKIGSNERPADVLLSFSDKIILSGTASIGAISLYASSIGNASITIGSNYNPSTNATLNLIAGCAMQYATDCWLNKVVLKSAYGTLNAADVAKFTLGYFCFSDETTQPISKDHTIDATGKLVLK